LTKEIIGSILDDNKITNSVINLIYCSDEYIHNINKEFLNHDYPTDVITFEIEKTPLMCEIYTSVDTAARQASEYNVTLNNELLRLAAHGALHICGMDDNTPDDRNTMKLQEDKYLERITKA